MKIRSLLALVGLAISFALPTVAQQTDPQLRQGLVALIQKHNDAINNNDAAAVAALYTDDAVLVEQGGPKLGREAIQKLWADRFQREHFSDLVSTVDDDFPHTLVRMEKRCGPLEHGVRQLKAKNSVLHKSRDSDHSPRRGRSLDNNPL
jgi:hypothetical protein